MRPELCAEALRLARLLAQLAPQEAEVLGLLALLELQASRLAARRGPDGSPVLLPDQDRRRWDRLHIRLGLQALAKAEGLSGRPGPSPQAAERDIGVGPVHRSGLHRGLSCPSGAAGGDRLAAHREPVRGPQSAVAQPDCRSQPGGGDRYGREIRRPDFGILEAAAASPATRHIPAAARGQSPLAQSAWPAWRGR